MNKKLIAHCGLLATLALLAGCASQKTSCSSGHVVTQFSTYDALAHGLYGGEMPVGKLMEHGDFGLGTLDGWDGEVVILDHKLYLIDGTGAVHVVTNMNVTTPFLEVMNFYPSLSRKIPDSTTYTDLQQLPTNYLPTLNSIFAVKISGTFRHVKTRSMPKQSKPYKPMAELVKTQPTFEFENVRGTMVGFWSPPSMKGVSLAGWHLHFLTADLQAGGHVLAFTTDNATLEAAESHHFNWLIPGGADYEREEFK